MKLSGFAAAGAAVLFAAGAARADEGMWTFDNFPAAAVKAKYGAVVDQPWLDHVRGAAVRLSGGCSASVVSGQGLVLTNHHCVADCAQDLSSSRTDYVEEGFTTAARTEERQCPGMQAEILTAITDVTDRVNKAAAGQTGQAFVRARDAEIAAIETSGCAGREATFRCQVITLYQGGQYKLYAYRKYADVRLVFAPEIDTAFFGGDPDNFNFPRYDLDCAFLRLYENGKPVATPGHLRWNSAAPKDGELVFVAGNPGSTSRLLTVDQLTFLRDISLPQTLLQYSELRGRLIRFASESEEHQRIATHQLFGIENSFKAFYGQLQALQSPALMDAKRKAEAELRAKVAADPALAARIGDPWGEIARAQEARAALNARFQFLENRAGYRSDLFGYARDLVRGAEERGKPNSERLPEFADARLPLLEKELLDAKPIDPEIEQQLMEFWLSKAREYLTADAPEVRTLIGKESVEALSARLAASKLADPAVRRQLWQGGAAAIRASDDPLIRFVLATDADARAVRKAYEERVKGPSDRASEQLARAQFAVYGDSIYPDATFSLRLSYGKIGGWTFRDQTVPSFTYIGGLWQRATGSAPFKLKPRWVAAQGKLDDATVFDVSTTNDIIGGNSGSPLINARGEVIGAVFDGNIHSLGGAFAYDEALNRSVAVSTAAISEALLKVYDQKALAAELAAK